MSPPLCRLKVPPELVKCLGHLHPTLKRKIRGGLDAVLLNPQVGKPLKAELSGLWSLPVGRLRIIYRIQESVIEIVAIGPRTTIYQEISQ